MTHTCPTRARRQAVRTNSNYATPERTPAAPKAPTPPTLPPALVQSSDRLLRLTELTRTLGISRSTVYRYLAAGRLPPPIHLSSRCIAWKASTISAWMDALAAS